MYSLTWEHRITRREIGLISISPPQVSLTHGLTSDRTLPSAFRGRWYEYLTGEGDLSGIQNFRESTPYLDVILI